MNLLQEVILSLSKEESRFFKLYAGRTNIKEERKDLLLFDFIKKADSTDEGKIAANFIRQKQKCVLSIKK